MKSTHSRFFFRLLNYVTSTTSKILIFWRRTTHMRRRVLFTFPDRHSVWPTMTLYKSVGSLYSVLSFTCHSLYGNIKSCYLNSGFPHIGAERQITRRNILVENFWINHVEIQVFVTREWVQQALAWLITNLCLNILFCGKVRSAFLKLFSSGDHFH